jgi:hypothetical protein
MASEGALLTERRRMPGWFFALLGFAAVLQVGAAIAAASVLPLLLSLPVLALVTLLLSHLRVVLTRTHLHIQYGLWGPKVALADIESVEVGAYAAVRFRGWGIKRALDGTYAYSTPGGNGQALTITARDANGAVKRWCITLDRADDFRREIDAARRATGVRVEAASSDEEAETHVVDVQRVERKKT